MTATFYPHVHTYGPRFTRWQSTRPHFALRHTCVWPVAWLAGRWNSSVIPQSEWQQNSIECETFSPKVSEWNVDENYKWYTTQYSQSTIYCADISNNPIQSESVTTFGRIAGHCRIKISLIIVRSCSVHHSMLIIIPALDMMKYCHKSRLFLVRGQTGNDHKHQADDNGHDVCNCRSHYSRCTVQFIK